MKLDKIDKQLLSLLQEDSKISIQDLCKALNLTKTPIYERIKRFEKLGVIDKYVAILNSKLIGKNMMVYCSVELESQKLSAIKSFSAAVENIDEVVECYLMGGASDFLLKVMVADLNDYHAFSSGKLAALPHVSQIKSTFVLNQTKRSTVIPIY